MKRIRVEVESKVDRKMLEDFLSKDYEIAERDFDLLILDSKNLFRLWDEIKELKSDVFLPVLLLTKQKPPEHLWQLIDDVIYKPVEKSELKARIKVLLRAREQALELKKHAKILEIELGTLFESIGHPIMVLNPNFEILYTNKKATELFGKNFGRKCYEVFHGRSEPIENCPMKALIESGETQTTEIELNDRTFLVTVTPIFIDKKLEKIIKIAIDVTELRETEKNLRLLFSELYRIGSLFRILYSVNRKILRAKSFEEIFEEVKKELNEIGECYIEKESERSCIKSAIEENKIVTEHDKRCKFYEEHKDKEVLAIPLSLNGTNVAMCFVSKKIGNSEKELLETLSEDIVFVFEKLKAESERKVAIDRLQKNIAEIAFLIDGIRNPLAVIYSLTELFGNEELKKRVEIQVERIDAVLKKLDLAWIKSEEIVEKS